MPVQYVKYLPIIHIAQTELYRALYRILTLDALPEMYIKVVQKCSLKNIYSWILETDLAHPRRVVKRLTNASKFEK